MNGHDAPPGGSEERLAGLLELLRSDEPRHETPLTESVMRTARWQYAVRGAAVAVTELAGVVVDGVALLLGVRAGRRGGAEEEG